jgi:hypothetical protein
MDHGLTDAELAEVSGGVDCNTAVGMAATHLCTAQALLALGDLCGAAGFLGQAKGVQEAGCPK